MSARGFTLLETLVALSILAIALGGVFRALGATTHSAAAVQERMLADWVADNRLAELRATRTFPAPGRSAGEAVQAGRRFRWQQEVGNTPNPLFRRVEIRVFRAGDGDEGSAISHLSGFVTRPLQ